MCHQTSLGNQYPETTRALPPGLTGRDRMFLFFSNRLGCFGSLVVSLALTAILILIFFR